MLPRKTTNTAQYLTSLVSFVGRKGWKSEYPAVAANTSCRLAFVRPEMDTLKKMTNKATMASFKPRGPSRMYNRVVGRTSNAIAARLVMNLMSTSHRSGE